MEPQTYFDKMRETSTEIDGAIFDSLKPLKQENHEMYEAVIVLVNKRGGLPKLRGHLAREAYVACSGGVDDMKWTSLATAVELELNAMYYRNQIFDDKAGCSVDNARNVISHWSSDSYSRDLAEKFLNEGYDSDPKLIRLLRESNMNFTVGEFCDTQQNIYSQSKNLTFNDQIDLCNKRIYGINASFIEKIAEMGGILAEGSNEQVKALGDFGRAWGMAGQIMNDVTDFVPPRLNKGTTEKTGNDAYSDIKHGKMTYPVIWLLENGSEKDKKLLEEILAKGQSTQPFQLEELTKVLVSSGAIDFAKQSVREYAKQAKSALHGGTFSKNERRYLSNMCTMFRTNRYYDALKEFEARNK